MNEPSPQQPELPALPSRVKPRRLSRILLGCAVIVAVFLIIVATRWRFSESPTEIPQVATKGLDRALATKIEAGIAKIKESPRSATEWGQLGELLRGQGLVDEADPFFREAARLDASEPRWHYFLGLRFVARQNPAAALPHLERAAANCEQNDDACHALHLRLAETLLQLNRDDEAEKHLVGVLKHDREDVRAHFNLGLLKARAGQVEQAANHLLLCVDSPLTRKKATAHLARLFAEVGNLEGARRYSQREGQLPADLHWIDPYIVEAEQLKVGLAKRRQEIVAMQTQGRSTEAIAELRKLVREQPDAEDLISLATELAKTKDYEAAIDVLLHATQLAPHSSHAHYLLGVVRSTQADELAATAGTNAYVRKTYEAAIGHLRKAIEIKPSNGLAHHYLGHSLHKLQRYEEAIAAYQLALQCRPNDAETHFALAKTHLSLGQHNEALAALEQAALLSPQDPRLVELRAEAQP